MFFHKYLRLWFSKFLFFIFTVATQITKMAPGALVLLYLVDPSWFSWCRHSIRAPSVIWNLRRSFELTVHVPSVSHRNKPQFTNQPAQVTNVPFRPWTLVRRVLYLLRECGGHRHLRLRAHVSVLRLWPQTQENVQRLLSYLQKTDQRHYQDVPQHVKVDHLGNTRSRFRNVSSASSTAQ